MMYISIQRCEKHTPHCVGRTWAHFGTSVILAGSWLYLVSIYTTPQKPYCLGEIFAILKLQSFRFPGGGGFYLGSFPELGDGSDSYRPMKACGRAGQFKSFQDYWKLQAHHVNFWWSFLTNHFSLCREIRIGVSVPSWTQSGYTLFFFHITQFS